MKNLFGSLFLCILPFQQYRLGSDQRQHEVKMHNRIVYTNYAVPTGALDSKTGKEIMGIFSDLNATGKTVILITHDRQIASYAKRLITIQDGRILSDEKM